MQQFLALFLSLFFCWQARIPGPGGFAPSGSSSTPFVTGQSLGTARNDFGGCVGYSFVVGLTSIVVTDLGRWVVSGNSGTHITGIIQTGGTYAVSTTIDTSGASAATYKYNSVTPTTLGTGTYYIVSEETNGGDQWYNDNTTVTTTTDATEAGSVYTATCPGTVSGSSIAPAAYVPLNFKYHL